MSSDAEETASNSKPRGPAPWMWLLGFAALLSLVVNSVFAYVAVRHGPGLLREDYYDAALHWDQRRAREAGFDALGVALTLQPGADTLGLNASAAPASPASLQRLAQYALELRLRRPDNAEEDRTLEFPPPAGSSGVLRWRIVTPKLRRGKWECRAVFRQNGQARLERSFAYFAEP